MKIILARIKNNSAVRFAQDELYRILRRMDPSLFIDSRVYDERDDSVNGALWLGVDGSLPHSEDDEILIDVKDGAGIITASSERAVLMAAYRFTFELGCRFLRPGADGEVIPQRKLDIAALNVSVHEKASYHHRGMCIEGAISYEHAYNMIDWLPKVGMNGYFMQFFFPAAFFRRFYNSTHNPNIPAAPVSNDDIKHIWARLEEEIIKRGLDYHAVGHGWTCNPFGIPALSWEKTTDALLEETKSILAEVNGKRELWEGGIALNTNLCYSNPSVRERMTDAITDYCREHPAVNYLHFWLADGKNNHCECAECRKMRPSDYYVMLLNELDRKLTAAKIDTKIVCLIYVDLLWEPETQKIANPDRFVLMFAPITRTYSTSFTDFDASESVELSPYVRNKLEMPRSVAENAARLKKWQTEQLPGDSFDFDYHLMWDHYTDPGYYECARILHTDMANLEKLGLRGMVSCQTQRAAFPTALPMYAMAKALWDKSSDFDDVCDEYFSAAFGEDGAEVGEYLKTLSRLFDPVYMRGEKPRDRQGFSKKCREAKAVIEEFNERMIEKNKHKNPSWMYLSYHADIAQKYADLLIAYSLGTDEQKAAAKSALCDTINSAEPYIHEGFDAVTFDRIYGRYVNYL